MKLTTAFLILAFANSAAFAADVPPDCGPLDDLLEYHANEYGERVVWMGYSEHYDTTTMILAEPSGGWSEVTLEGQTACLIDYGHSSKSDFDKKGERV